MGPESPQRQGNGREDLQGTARQHGIAGLTGPKKIELSETAGSLELCRGLVTFETLFLPACFVN